MKKNHIWLAGTILISCLFPYIRAEADELIGSYWLSDRVLIVQSGDTYTDMVAAVRTDKGIVVIDSGVSPSLTNEYRRIIEKEFGRSDFEYVINTHHHIDHTNGNQVFDDAEIIAHKNAVSGMQENDVKDEIYAYVKQTRERILSYNEIMETLEKDSGLYNAFRDRVFALNSMCDDYESTYQLKLPTLRITDNLTLDMGDLRIEIVYFGSGFHTDNDLVVSIPEENIVFMGDIIQAFDRFFRVNSKSEIDPWISSLDRIINNNNEVKKVVAYHVGVLPGAVLRDFRESLIAMRNEQRQKKTAVDSLRAMIATSTVQEAVIRFEDQFLNNTNDTFFIWEGDLLSLAVDYQEKEKYSEALMLLKMYEKIFPNSTRILFSQANIFASEGRNSLAIDAYKKMLRIDPTNFYYVEKIFQLKNGH